MHFSILKKKFYVNLKNKKIKLCIAESITGGYLTSEIIKIPGASEIFLYGIVSYSNKSKKSILGIKNLISSHGVVSKEVAEEMVKKISKFSEEKKLLSLSCTGYALSTNKNKKNFKAYISAKFKKTLVTKEINLEGFSRLSAIKYTAKEMTLLGLKLII